MPLRNVVLIFLLSPSTPVPVPIGRLQVAVLQDDGACLRVDEVAPIRSVPVMTRAGR